MFKILTRVTSVFDMGWFWVIEIHTYHIVTDFHARTYCVFPTLCCECYKYLSYFKHFSRLWTIFSQQNVIILVQISDKLIDNLLMLMVWWSSFRLFSLFFDFSHDCAGIILIMGWKRQSSERGEEGSVRRSTVVDGYEIEMNCPQFAATSFKYLDLSNPLRRYCIRIVLSP